MCASGMSPGGCWGDDAERILVAVQGMRDDLGERLDKAEHRMARVEAALGGNGRPGLKERISSLETYVRVLAGMVALATPIVATVGCEVIKRLNGHP